MLENNIYALQQLRTKVSRFVTECQCHFQSESISGWNVQQKGWNVWNEVPIKIFVWQEKCKQNSVRKIIVGEHVG